MTKRKTNNYEESFKDFATSFKKHINEELKLWKKENHMHAKGRQMAYSSCLFELKRSLEKNNLTLSDIGLASYEVPEVGGSNE